MRGVLDAAMIVGGGTEDDDDDDATEKISGLSSISCLGAAEGETAVTAWRGTEERRDGEAEE